MRSSLFAWSHFRTENRFPPRIKSGAGFFPENALSRRRIDRRRAVAPALRQAVVELALLEHGIGEPNPAADHDDNEKQQERVGDPAIARGLHVSIFFPLFGLVHARMVASLCAQRNTGCSGSIMRVSLPGLTRQSI